MVKKALLWCIYTTILVVTPWTIAKAQGTGDDWASLSIPDFVTESETLLAQEQTDAERDALRQSLAEHAAGRLRGLTTEDTLARDTFIKLYNLGGLQLTEQEQATISQRAVPPRSETAGWTFEQYFEEFGRITSPHIPEVTKQTLADQWLADHPVLEYGDRIADEMFPIFHDKSDLARCLTAQEIIASTARHCRTKLAEPDVRSTVTAEDRLRYLRPAVWWLSGEEREELVSKVCPTAAEAASWTLEELLEIQQQIKKLGFRSPGLSAATCNWLKTHSEVDLSVDDSTELWFRSAVPAARAYKLTATWTGSITAPTTGSYEFSICPINVNLDHPSEKMHHTVAVWIDGKQVINSTPENWSPDGGSVNLQADQAVPIRYELIIECVDKRHSSMFPGVAQLLWKGPGLAKSVVPSSALTPPSGTGNGLEGEYTVTHDDGEPEVIKRIDPALDLVWDGLYPIQSEFRTELTSLASKMHAKVMDPVYLAACESGGENRQKHKYFTDPVVTELLSSQQRAEFVDEVLTRPALLEEVSGSEVIDLYLTVRVGALDSALHMVGKWCQMHADIGQVYANRPFAYRDWWYHLTQIFIVSQYRPHMDLLEQQYLATPDGSCSLPAAYILTHAYLVDGRLDQWIAMLDAMLEEESITGDTRVNWLLARAYTEEIRTSRPARGYPAVVHPLRGRQWIQEATLIAETEPVRLRAYQQLVARWAAAEQFGGARELVGTAQNRLTSPASQEAFTCSPSHNLVLF